MRLDCSSILLNYSFVVCNSSAMEVEKAFLDNEIVPDILQVAPKRILNVAYRSGVTVDLGKELTPTQVKDQPTVSWEAEKGAYYTLMMMDPDAPSRTDFPYREARHWLVVNIPESYVQKGDHITEYVGSGPPKGTGLHRYTFLVYKQPNGIIKHDEPRTTSRSRAHRLKTSASATATKYNLGDPVFGNFYLAQYDEYVDVIQAQTTD